MFGPRTAVEAVFLIAVPVTALAIGLDKWRIIGASAVGYLLVVLLEVALGRRPVGAQVAPESVPAVEAPLPVELPVEPEAGGGRARARA